jgi:hypothetical protein
MAVRKRHKTSLTNHMTIKEQDSLLTMGFCMGFILTGFMHMWEDSRLVMFLVRLFTGLNRLCKIG